MDLVYILQIITICISIFTVVMNIIITLYVNKTQNVANVVAKQRLFFLKQYRKYSSELFTLCHACIIKENKTVEIKSIIEKSYLLKSIFKDCYEEEHEIIVAINELVDTAIKFSNDTDNNQLQIELGKKLNNLENLINIYDHAYWRFIIDQSAGKKYMVDDFDKYHKNAKEQFESFSMNLSNHN